jgi:surface antigen
MKTKHFIKRVNVCLIGERRKTGIILLLLCLLGNLFMLSSTAQALDFVLKEKNGFVGEDKIPYTVYSIKKPSDFKDLPSWINNYYSNDTKQAIHILTETMLNVTVNGEKAIAFKTWEIEALTQNILIDTNKKTLTLYTTPHFEGNLDGSTVFKEILNFTLPVNDYTNLSNVNYQPDVLQESEEESNFLFDLDSSDILQSQASSCSSSTKCKDNVVIGSYNGVNAYSNGEFTGTASYCGYYSSGNYKYQCTEYVKRYYRKAKGKNLDGIGNANQYCTNASKYGLSMRWNCDPKNPNVPWPGDIIVKTSGSYGHVGIVKSVGSNYVDVVSQNWSKCNGVQRLNMTRKKNSQGVEYACVDIYGQGAGYQKGCWLWK